ncbi:MAG: AMP-dependent synthetase [Rhodospirillales bacterium 20-64-7]|nr:MAG: AMP-dependent synthetase [Rhodospirillales bacterium 20-64-7]
MVDGAMQSYALTLDRFLDHAAKWHGGAEIVTASSFGAERVGYAAARDRALRMSAVLAGYGVGQGERVATLAWNTQAHFEAWYAIIGMGAVCHTLNPRLTPLQIAAMLRQSGAAVMLVSADLAPLAQQILDQGTAVAQILLIDEAAERVPAGLGGRSGASVAVLEQALAGAQGDLGNALRWGGFSEEIPSGLCFTSGTTAAPKGVTYTHRSSFLHTLRLLQADVLGITAADAVLAAVPMFHANGWGLPFAVPAVGAKLVLPGRHLDGASLARLIAAEGVTVAAGVPTVWLGLIQHLDACGGALPSLRRILVGGAPLPAALMALIEQRLGATVQTSWGMTELSPLGTMARPGEPHRDAARSGRPALGVDLLLTDATGTALPEQRNVEGHLRVRGASAVARYFGEATLATDAKGWFDTGDLARLDDEGNLMITGRAKDLIKSGGEWINPAEIEAIIRENGIVYTHSPGTTPTLLR